MIKIPVASGEPALTLQISTERSRGVVSVRDETGIEVQRLTCALLWLYDPKQHSFTRDFLAEQMELLTNLEPLAGGQISTSHRGPENMWRAVYRITGAEGSRPVRQLIPAYSCLVETTPGGVKATAIVTAQYQSGQTIVQRHQTGKMNIKAALNRCDSSPEMGESRKSQSKN
jgi:hypothetical protein